MLCKMEILPMPGVVSTARPVTVDKLNNMIRGFNGMLSGNKRRH